MDDYVKIVQKIKTVLEKEYHSQTNEIVKLEIQNEINALRQAIKAFIQVRNIEKILEGKNLTP